MRWPTGGHTRRLSIIASAIELSIPITIRIVSTEGGDVLDRTREGKAPRCIATYYIFKFTTFGDKTTENLRHLHITVATIAFIVLPSSILAIRVVFGGCVYSQLL